MENSLATQVVARLAQRGWRISFAESCTGGLAAARLVDVPNASGVFEGSFVTYSENTKVRLVGVDPAAIAEYGVVSERVAREMAAGCARAVGAEVGVGITGIAGPSGGTPETPVGTVCFAFAVNHTVTAETMHFGALGREAVREAAVAHVFARLAALLA
ncbi:MAG: CinA family protein [Firmicutes bacterium]|nr:CinA family protein [Bacillota bacterium]